MFECIFIIVINFSINNNINNTIFLSNKIIYLFIFHFILLDLSFSVAINYIELKFLIIFQNKNY